MIYHDFAPTAFPGVQSKAKTTLNHGRSPCQLGVLSIIDALNHGILLLFDCLPRGRGKGGFALQDRVIKRHLWD